MHSQPASTHSAAMLRHGEKAAGSLRRRPLGQILLEQGALAPGDLLRALALQARQEARLGDILLSHGMVTDAQLMTGLAKQYRARPITSDEPPPDPRVVDRIGAANCLRMQCLPWRSIGGATLVATSRPDMFELLRPELEQQLGPVVMGLISEANLHRALMHTRSSALKLLAETSVAEAESCRNWASRRPAPSVLILATVALGPLVLAPTAFFAILLAVAVVALVGGTVLKLAATMASLRAGHSRDLYSIPGQPRSKIPRLPCVSVMVPLYNEPDIAPRLIQRLGALTYPKELLDVLLVVEEDDTMTREALAGAGLPRWMRVVEVPDSRLKTKPRALNFAMSFARGSIIGIYDAEDAPDPDQIHRVARRFHERGAELACVQGILDYYNPDTNWLARCFTIEYAAWFRLILPGIERLGLAVPLGGTTLFFRREILEELGGWDAHNVTEDADLGIRLARHGYRTELLATVTREEANCRALPWIRQRSRWLKGYAITYAVHMRDPRLLLRQLGLRKFLGFQVMFLGTLIQFTLAPILWSFWLMLFGLWHPVSELLPHSALLMLAGAFVFGEIATITINYTALSAREHRSLRPWVPTLHFYFPLASLAAYKGLWELVAHPFYWDKTAHGVFDTQAADPLELGANMPLSASELQ